VGDKLGHYEILALTGKGGMGEVYRAHDSRADGAARQTAEALSVAHEKGIVHQGQAGWDGEGSPLRPRQRGAGFSRCSAVGKLARQQHGRYAGGRDSGHRRERGFPYILR